MASSVQSISLFRPGLLAIAKRYVPSCETSMLAENPYQSPSADCSVTRVALENRDYPPDKCPCCNSNVTFWGFIRPSMPLRYTCSRCGERYKKSAPWLGSLENVPAIILILVEIGSGYGLIMTDDLRFMGAVFAVLALTIYSAIISNRYFLKRGKLVPCRVVNMSSDPVSKN